MNKTTTFRTKIRRSISVRLRSESGQWGIACLCALMLIVLPDVALAAGGGGAGSGLATGLGKLLQSVVDIMTGSIARLVGIIAVAGLGYAWLTGRMDAMRALVLCIGIGLIFGAAEIVDAVAPTI